MNPDPVVASDGARDPSVAALLAFLSPGLGHAYGGRRGRGLVFFFIPLAALSALVVLSHVEPSRGVLWGILAAFLAPPVTHLLSILDAWRLARRERGTFARRHHRRLPLYAVWLVLGISYPLAGMLWVRTNALQAFALPTQSMKPTLLRGDRVLVVKHAYRGSDVRRGDVVVFRHASEPGVHYVKRVVGIPGDRLSVRDGFVELNGAPLPTTREDDAPPGVRIEEAGDRRYRVFLPGESWGRAARETIEVPAGHAYLLGDQRRNSRDSRHFGPVPLSGLVGKATYLFWMRESWNRFGVIR